MAPSTGNPRSGRICDRNVLVSEVSIRYFWDWNSQLTILGLVGPDIRPPFIGWRLWHPEFSRAQEFS
jgi:hypothetical protein